MTDAQYIDLMRAIGDVQRRVDRIEKRLDDTIVSNRVQIERSVTEADIAATENEIFLTEIDQRIMALEQGAQDEQI